MWEHPINNNLKYEMIYPRPTNERNIFYYIFFQKLHSEKLCDSTVDSLTFDLGKKLFIRSLQGKNSNIYLRIKKRGRIIDMRKFIDFKTTVFNCVISCFNFYCQNDDLLNQNYFADFRLIKTNSGNHFHFICIFRDKYVNRFWERFPP